MKTILVDTDYMSMELFEQNYAAGTPDIEIMGKFTNSQDALDYASSNLVEFALLDIIMPQMDGIALGRKLKEINPNIIIIFVSAYSEYAVDALRIKADYYVIKPYSRNDMQDALRRAKLLYKGQKIDITVRTFGRFDIFVNNRLVTFTNAKSKELLALCVDRMGGEVTMEEAIDKLWENKDYDSRAKALYRKAIICAGATLKEYGISEIFAHSRGSCHLIKDRVDCDYYNFLEHKEGCAAYTEEYMFEYSWAEATNAKLSSVSKKSNLSVFNGNR